MPFHHSPKPTPPNLEERVLQAIHQEQRAAGPREQRFWLWAFSVSSVVCVTSLALLIYGLIHNQTFSLLTTVLTDSQFLSLSDTVLALLETIPLGRLALTCSAASIVFILMFYKQSHTPLRLSSLQSLLFYGHT